MHFSEKQFGNITRQLNEKDLTVSVSLYKSSPERWYDVRYKVCYCKVQNIYVQTREREREREREGGEILRLREVNVY